MTYMGRSRRPGRAKRDRAEVADIIKKKKIGCVSRYPLGVSSKAHEFRIASYGLRNERKGGFLKARDLHSRGKRAPRSQQRSENDSPSGSVFCIAIAVLPEGLPPHTNESITMSFSLPDHRAMRMKLFSAPADLTNTGLLGRSAETYSSLALLDQLRLSNLFTRERVINSIPGEEVLVGGLLLNFSTGYELAGLYQNPLLAPWDGVAFSIRLSEADAWPGAALVTILMLSQQSMAAKVQNRP